MSEIRIGINGFGRIGLCVDAKSTLALRGRVAKILSWYDNEWGW